MNSMGAGLYPRIRHDLIEHERKLQGLHGHYTGQPNDPAHLNLLTTASRHLVKETTGQDRETTLLGSGLYKYGLGNGEFVVLVSRNQYSEGYGFLRLKLNQWCADQAIKVDVSTPRFISVSYDPIIHALVEQVHGQRFPDPGKDEPRPGGHTTESFYEALGGIARKLSAIEAPGFGQLGSDSNGAIQGEYQSWRAYRRYLEGNAGISLYNGKDSTDLQKFLRRGLVSQNEIEDLRINLITYTNLDLPPRLCHGDLFNHNVIVCEKGKLWVLDWDGACGGYGLVSPLADFIARNGFGAESQAFLKGYVRSDEEKEQFLPAARALAALEILRGLIHAPEPRHEVFSEAALMRRWKEVVAPGEI
jgi:Phosphotransferase enzyme family